jgi:hypothetical protein
MLQQPSEPSLPQSCWNLYACSSWG